MANKRNLKKSIRYTCGDVAGECLFAKYNIDGIDADKMNDCIIKTADLQCQSLDKISVSYDKTLKSFDGNAKAYRKARRNYFKTCFVELAKEMNDGIENVVVAMNAALPKAQKEANKQNLSK